MPQWRKLHAKIVDSLDFNAMPDDFTRLLWALLPLGVDREGRGIDDSSWVRSKLMPLRRDVALEAIEFGMGWFAEHGMIVRYETNGGHYFYIPTFSEYQGKTDREAPSKLPGPVVTNSGAGHDQLMTNTRPAQDLLMKRSSTDSDSDSDAEADSKHTPPPPANPAPARPPIVGGGVGSQSVESMRETLNALELYFSELTGLVVLPARTSGQKDDAAARSWTPLTQLYKLCGGDLEATKVLLKGAVGHMRAQHLTIAAPKSVLSVATRLHAETKGQRRSRDDPAAVARLTQIVESERARVEAERARTGNV